MTGGENLIDLAWWITVVELPAFGSIFLLILHARKENERTLFRIYRETQRNMNIVLDELAQFKVEVARTYVAVQALKDVETRLTAHLIRLETRLGSTVGEEPRSGMRGETATDERTERGSSC